MATRQEVENALNDLAELLTLDTCDEEKFQSWFEKHPAAFEAYGYKQWIPHPRIRFGEDEFVPDLLAQRIDGLWEILELKRPDTKVLKNKERRRSFYSDFESYLAQCNDYMRAFGDPTSRRRFNDTYSVDVQEVLECVLVAGRKQQTELAEVHSNLVVNRNARIRLQTYDHVLDRLEFLRATQFAHHEGLPGFSVHLVFAPSKLPGRDNYIFDLGTNETRNRLSLLIDASDHLCFKVYSDNEAQQAVRVSLNDALIRYDQLTYIVIELGLARDYSHLSVEVDGGFATDRRLDPVRFEQDPGDFMVLGSDVGFAEHSEFAMMRLMLFDRVLSFSERRQIADGILADFGPVFRDEAGTTARVFSGHQFFASANHPSIRNHGQTVEAGVEQVGVKSPA